MIKYKPNVIMEMIGSFYFLIANLWIMLSIILNAFGYEFKWYWTVLALIINLFIFKPSDELIEISTMEY